MLNKLSLCGKWKELKFGLKLFNKILTRHYINFYWKVNQYLIFYYIYEKKDYEIFFKNSLKRYIITQ